MDPHFRRLSYVRYAYDFILGLTSRYKEAVNIKERIKILNNLKLELKYKKIKITSFTQNKKPVFFLGTIIYGDKDKEKPVGLSKRGCISLKIRVTLEISMRALIRKIFERALQNGFFKNDKNLGIRPTSVRRIMNFDHQDIILHYNQVIRGIINFYSFVDNRSALGSFVHGMKDSCAFSLAKKSKLKSGAQG